MSQLIYKGILMIPVEITPRPQDTDGCIAIDNLHCTMLLPSQLRVLKELVGLSNMGLTQWVEGVIEQIADPPMLVLGSETHLATRLIGGFVKRTHFIEVMNQDEMQAWLNTLTDALLLPNVERYFHVSVANDTGKPTDSIGDIDIEDWCF